ncbi:related to VPS53 - subunit of VP51-54 complex, required for protein sorting [Melanopsichium pennsylvanicum]|uniref:Related to VPS53 - subunit of VP51-54 complex, required for protein sorting n=2 Tax=Melanopsichium pennsylvanicum TaxID=63383 RepID=A0AAJ5C5N0_9BASI|nr:related to VPS53-subunit of VP51-54 complex, required for protein sorting [Melanopsichium pennsylvanicum 4]SNX84704.1 related to VPS53 - subunit of VP51-54 complex, required for protein sorting [Melanopsichium pennsylvanicum]
MANALPASTPGNVNAPDAAPPPTPSKSVELSHDVAVQIDHILSSDDKHQQQSLNGVGASYNLADRSSLESQLDQLLACPTEEPLSLASINRVQAVLRLQIQSCRDQISQLTAELETEIDANRMSQVQHAIATLLEQLLLIREKARESENVVKEITRDIRSLDIAKRNVVSSMTALKRLQMLVNGVDQLQRLAETKRYREAASALQAVRSLLDFFQSYRGVERIASAWKQVGELQQDLRNVIMKDYENFFLHDPNRAVRSTSLPESALVIDAIGFEAKTALIDWYCSLQLREYRRIFRATDEAGQLDNVSRRFAWFRRILKVHEEEHAPAFLDHWKAEPWLIRKFADVTKDDLRSVLIREQSRLNVSTLMEALNSTLEFEATMSRKYKTSFEELIAPPSSSSNNVPQTQQQQQQQQASTQPQVQTLSAIFDPYLGVFVEAQDRALSEMFVQYRQQGTRVSHDGFGISQNQSGGGGFGGESALDPSNGPDAAGSGSNAGNTVLPSSTELFYFYRQTLEQCARLSNREPLRDLYEVYRRWLRVYAEDVLRSALIRPEPARRSIDVRPNISEIQKWCLVLNTADYCASTSSQLEDKLREKIHPDFRDTISLDEERNIFTTLISYAVQTLARELELCSEPIWNSMLRPAVPWSQLQPRSGNSSKSQYVIDMASLLEQIGVVVRQDVENKRYVRSWCDKVVGVLTTRFMQGLVRLRPLTQGMAEQMLVDAGELRKSLIELPRYPVDDLGVGTDGSTNTTEASLSHWMPKQSVEQVALSTQAASYVRYVHRLTDRIEMLLRVVLAPIEVDRQAQTSFGSTDDDGRSLDLIQSYVQLVGDRSFSNFQKVLDLKGVRKVDQNGLLDRFLQVTSSHDGSSHFNDLPPEPYTRTSSSGVELTDQSFLSQLDMDPPSVPILSSPFTAATPSFLDSATRRDSTSTSQYRSTSLFGPDSLRSPTMPSTGTFEGPHAGAGQGGAGRAFSDLRKFGNFFGALGRKDGR